MSWMKNQWALRLLVFHVLMWQSILICRTTRHHWFQYPGTNKRESSISFETKWEFCWICATSQLLSDGVLINSSTYGFLQKSVSIQTTKWKGNMLSFHTTVTLVLWSPLKNDTTFLLQKMLFPVKLYSSRCSIRCYVHEKLWPYSKQLRRRVDGPFGRW